MFDNIGGKLKTWAKVFYAIELIAGIIYGIVKIVLGFDSGDDGEMLTSGIFTLLLAPFVGLLLAWLIYAFGHLVEQTEMNQENTRRIKEILAKGGKVDFEAENAKEIKFVRNTYTPTQTNEEKEGEKEKPENYSNILLISSIVSLTLISIFIIIVIVVNQ